jgi:hypothetical protein
MTTTLLLTFPQISACMKGWCSTFGMEGILQSVAGEGEAVQTAFKTLLQ